MSVSATNTYPIGSGYRCVSCGGWINYGTWHNCPMQWSHTYTWQPQPTKAEFDALVARVADLEAEVKRLRRPKPRP